MSRPDITNPASYEVGHRNADDLTAQGDAAPGSPAIPATTNPAPFKPGKAIRFIRCIAFISLILATLFLLFNFEAEQPVPQLPAPVASGIPGQSRQAALPPPPAAPAPQKKRLPGSIPLDAPDAAYAAAHPGWQRYESASCEFRVLQSNDTVKAIQVLAKDGSVISADFFRSFLAEIAGNVSFLAGSSEEKDGYLIEKGSAGETAKVIVYRKNTSGEILAFVVAYP